jgi:hypothetical protein
VLFAVGAGALVPSWFWFARNLRATGNPIFPIAVPALGWPGLFTSTAFNPGKELEFVAARWRWLLYPWTERTSHESGLGAGFAVLIPVAAVLLWALLRRLARGRVPAFFLPLSWGALYLVVWWVATPHEPRHLLPLCALCGVPALLLVERHPRLVAPLAAGLLFSTVMDLRTLAFSEVAELSARPRDYADLYALPPAATEAIPDGSLIANLAGRPYNFPLLGPRQSFRLRDYSPAPPSDTDLSYHGVDFLLYRGPPAGLAARPWWKLVYRAPVSASGLWDARAGDELRLYRLHR